MSDKFVRFNDDEATTMLAELAKADKRSEGNEVAWLILQEWARRFSSPNPMATIEEALEKN